MKKRIVLCADDYGQAPAISQAIVSLIQNNRLTATSCMVNSIYWPEHAGWLVPHLPKIDIGMHFNLTEGFALSQPYIDTYGPALMPLQPLMLRSFLRVLNQSVIEAELNAQLDKFLEVMGFLPNFLDGHQHVHQLPVIRSALLSVYEQRLRLHHKIYIRLTKQKFYWRELFNGFKKLVIQATGAKTLKRLLEDREISYNPSFSGIYSFKQAGQYGKFFPQFLAESTDGGVIMCHPGLSSSMTSDAIANARFEEYQYLSSAQFLDDCEREGVVLNRFVGRSGGRW